MIGRTSGVSRYFSLAARLGPSNPRNPRLPAIVSAVQGVNVVIRATGLFLGLVLVACSTQSSTPVARLPITVQSRQFPNIEIRCDGDIALPVGDCLDWAEKMLPAAPTRPSGGDLPVAKLVLTYRTGTSRCAADYFAADGRLVMTMAAECPSL